jgi:hypothetical protein
MAITPLTTKIADLEYYANCRLAVGVALFLSFLFHLVMNYAVRILKKFSVEM